MKPSVKFILTILIIIIIVIVISPTSYGEPETDSDMPVITTSIFPEIIVDESDLSIRTVQIEFPFNNEIVNGSVDVKLAPYYGAKNSEKIIQIYGDEDDTEWEVKYYDAMTSDPALEDLYRNLIIFFDNYAERHALTSDEYAELLTSFVQTIPYKSELGNARFPIETVIDNYGDCDDKSILLAGILSRKGYDAALLDYGIHMTAGISNGYSYRMIETTRSAFIGEDSELAESGVTTTTPKIYKIGSGVIPYYSFYKVDAVIEAEKKLSAECDELDDKMESLNRVIENQERTLSYNSDDLEYNRYSQNVDKYNSYVYSYNAKSNILTKISDERYNLNGVYNAVSSIM